ncbi:MAG: hypothetical protein LBO78_01595 [Rickettsiales bacterium]|jgi:hypothetical protein|nr:hypothetical protein [Rickettsiales bacterium]
MKSARSIAVAAVVSGCMAVPVPGDVEDSEVFHWEKETVTMEKFISDHKACLGVKNAAPRSRMENLLNPMEPYTMPKWDGMWATFESRGYRETGQRVAFSIPSSGGGTMTGQYRKCMLNLGYALTYKR